MQGVGTRGRLGRPDAQGRHPDGMSTQRRIQNCDLRLVRPLPETHPAHQAQSEILADVYTYVLGLSCFATYVALHFDILGQDTWLCFICI